MLIVCILLALLCVGLAFWVWAQRRSLREAAYRLRALEDTGSTARVRLAVPNSAAEELLDEVNRLLELRQADRAAYQARERALRQQIANVSHDLRTPLTSIFIFTEILRHKCRDCAPQLEEYVDKIDQKARRMKQLSDHLFEYALVTSETQAPLDPPTSFQAAFLDVFSETAAFLQQQGFSVSLDLDWKTRTVQVSDGYVARIFDNLVSNLLKYAAPAFPISARTQYGRAWAGFVLENRTRDPGDQVESTRIGLHNISAMMQNMGGRCDVEQEGDRFRIALRFPCLPSYDTDRTIPPSLGGGTEWGPDEKVQKGLDKALEE